MILPDKILRHMSETDRKSLGKAGLTREDCEKKAALRNERDLHRIVAAYLTLKGIEVFRQRMDKRSRGPVGWPDFTFAAKGVPVVWELKLPGQKLSDEQELMGQNLKKNGWRHAVIRSLDDAKRALWQACGL